MEEEEEEMEKEKEEKEEVMQPATDDGYQESL